MSSNQSGGSPYLPGDQIGGRFDVVEILGLGGFATVYKVFDQFEQQYWAMKVFIHTKSNDAVRREIASLRQVQHPNVLHVVWADRTPEGYTYLLSELLVGETLERYANGAAKLPDIEVFRLGEQLLSALQAVHPNQERIRALESRTLSEEDWQELQKHKESGFVHRDVKPMNLFLTDAGLKLLDFNIASRVGDPVFTQSGTPAYQPPDLDLTSWSPSVDLFAAGVTLYELYCHHHPYPDGVPRIDEAPIDPVTYRKEVSPRFRSFLLKACAPLATERFSTATEMLAELQICSASSEKAEAAETGSPHLSTNRVHETNLGGCDTVEVRRGELARLAELGGDWPAVFSCNRDGAVWATFGKTDNVRGIEDLLDLGALIVRRERPTGGRFQISDNGIYVWALQRWVAEFVVNEE